MFNVRLVIDLYFAVTLFTYAQYYYKLCSGVKSDDCIRCLEKPSIFAIVRAVFFGYFCTLFWQIN